MKKHNIEFLRFVFSLMIVLYHITHVGIMTYVGENEVYLHLQDMTVWSWGIVECFLIIGGYMLFRSYERDPAKPFAAFALGRFIRLWPVYAVYILCLILLGKIAPENIIFDLAFLRCTGITPSFQGIVWYVAPFFWCSLLIYGVLKSCKPGASGVILGLFAYFGYVINLNFAGGSLHREMAYNFLSLGMLRVLAGLSLGVLIGKGMSAFSAAYGTAVASGKKIGYILVSCGEVSTLTALFLIFLTNRVKVMNIFCVVILFSVLLVCFAGRGGVVSDLLNRPVFSKLGRYAYSIYVMQQVSFYILDETLWKNKYLICEHEHVTIALSLLFPLLVGAATYYLVERPVYRIFKKWESKRLPDTSCS